MAKSAFPIPLAGYERGAPRERSIGALVILTRGARAISETIGMGSRSGHSACSGSRLDSR